METCKTNAIQAQLDIFTHIPAYSEIIMHITPYSGTFRHNQAYQGNIQAPSDIFRGLCNTEIFRTLLCSEPPRHIQNPGISRILACSEPKAYSEPCQTSMMERFAKIVNGYSYFCNINFSRSLLYEINIMTFLIQV